MKILRLLAAPLCLMVTGTAWAESAGLSPSLAPLNFLVGEWKGDGKVEAGGTSRGTSSVQPALGGAALVRRDHTDLFNAKGKATGGFDQLMLIYPEGDAIHADYLDGEHVIHYVRADVGPGSAVTFVSALQQGVPAFRLTYALTAGQHLRIKFEMKPPGQGSFLVVAEGEVERAK